MTSHHPTHPWFALRSDGARNWLALGLLLAAWNFSDNDAVTTTANKPAPLHKHPLVTVRSVRAHNI